MPAGGGGGWRKHAVFKLYSNGVKTHRDVWAYNSSKNVLTKNMKQCIDYCNKQNPNKPIIDPTQVKWSPGLSDRLKKLPKQKIDENKIRVVAYRPFFKQYLYFDKDVFTEVVVLIPKLFPKPNSENLVIIVPYKFTGEFSTFITNITPDLEVIHHGQCFPMYVYEDKKRKENITDHTLVEYQKHYKDEKITKKDIFYYVYGLLHHPTYKKEFANNLSRELPHIPMAPDFDTFKDIGHRLAKLHLKYDTCSRYNLGKPQFNPKRFTKLGFGKKKACASDGGTNIPDHSVIKADGVILFKDIPEIKYTVNGRTPPQWVVDRYRKTTDKESGIANDPCTGTDIVAVIERAIFVGVESDKIIAELPAKFKPENWKPTETGLDKYSKIEN